jgi:fatty-acyl-CoA synthase
MSASQENAERFVPATLVEAIDLLARRDVSRGFTFIKPDGTERYCSYQSIREEAVRRAAHLRSLGLEKGDRLALVIPDGDEFVLSFIGAVYAGIVPVPIFPQLSFKNIDAYHDSLAHIARASGAKRILTTASTREFVEPVLAKVETLQGVSTVDALLAPAPSNPELQKPANVTPDDICFLQFTSGSTSRPKGVVVTHGNLSANSRAFVYDGLNVDPNVDKGVSWLPLFHDMGLIGFMIGPLFCEISVVFIPTASFVRAPRIWLDTMNKHRGTITYAPNFAYALVAKRVKDKDLAEMDLSCVRAAGCGAEPIQAKTLRTFAEKLAPAKFDPKCFVASYGMAEGTLAISLVRRGVGLKTDIVDSAALTALEARPSSKPESSQEIVSCGKWFPKHEVAIVDEQNIRLGERQVGQIITRGPSISRGYFQEPELTAAAFKDGPDGQTWLYTGDLGYIANDEVFICGRVKDIIIIRGRNFYPQDIEWVVSELPGVRRGNVVAFGVGVDASGQATKDGSGEEHLVVCAEAFQSDAEGLVETITSAISADIGLAVHRVEIVQQGSLPRTSSGKPQRRKTRQMFIDGTLLRARGGAGSPDTDPSPSDARPASA